MISERIEGTFDAVRCEKVRRGHVLMVRDMEEIVYVGPIAGAPKERRV